VAQTRSAAYLTRDADLETQIAAYENDVRVMFADPHAQHRYEPVAGGDAPEEWDDYAENAMSHVVTSVLLRRGVTVPLGLYTASEGETAEAYLHTDRLWLEVGPGRRKLARHKARCARSLQAQAAVRRTDRQADRAVSSEQDRGARQPAGTNLL
jgi:hypothetical protein